VEALALAGCDVGLKDKRGRMGREVAEGQGHALVLVQLRAVAADRELAAQAAGPRAPEQAPVPEPAALTGGEPVARWQGCIARVRPWSC
jgi:hypothetical protein